MSKPADRYTEYRLTKTKIIATVGPACGSREMLKELILAGADVFRLNFAHGSHEWLTEIVKTIWELSIELERPVGILGDLSGPKIRLGNISNDEVNCVEGNEISFVRGRSPEGPHELDCTYEALIDDVKPGDRILMADGTVQLRVLESDPAAGFARCLVVGAGIVRSRQGVNLPGVTLSTPSLTKKDREDLAFAIEHELDYVGLSFVRAASDIVELREVIAGYNAANPPQIVAKIEKTEAVDDLEAIIDATDAVMVARGDLGVEADIVQVPSIQKRIIRLCNQRRVPVITATQMLDSMQHSELPTRAEASDVFNAVLDGTDAVMLSGESAAGEYPRQSVAMMSRIVAEAERLLHEQPVLRTPDESSLSLRATATTEALAIGAVATARSLNSKLIAVATISGRSALAVSKERSRIPVLAICDLPNTARRMSLLWGITPVLASERSLAADRIIQLAESWGIHERVLEPGSNLIAVASVRSAEGHDSLFVHQVN
jgi:pyruvate kinase